MQKATVDTSDADTQTDESYEFLLRDKIKGQKLEAYVNKLKSTNLLLKENLEHMERQNVLLRSWASYIFVLARGVVQRLLTPNIFQLCD